MERVDVVVVGGGLVGLAAAKSAAAGGVRTILVEQHVLPMGGGHLNALCRRDLEEVGIKPSAAERVLAAIQVGDEPRASLGEDSALHVLPVSKLHQSILKQARKAGAEIRDRAKAVQTQLDPEGWIVELSSGEPIRAPILIVADGVRSPTLRNLGIAEAQRFSTNDAEIATFFCAQWSLDREESARQDRYRVIERGGPMSRYEILPGEDSICVAFGPVWQSPSDEHEWPSATHPVTLRAIEIARSHLGLGGEPSVIEIEEWRLDALPSPATFDGGIVLGGAAGHRMPVPLTASGNLIRQGLVGGAAAAKSVLEKEWGASALGARLGAEYDQLVSAATACRDLEAHGLRRHRTLPVEFWKRGRPDQGSIPVGR